MFRKLLIRLTLLNASVIAVLFFFLIAGAYLFAQYDINRHSKSFLTRVAADINAGRRPPMFPGPINDPALNAAPESHPAPRLQEPRRRIYHLAGPAHLLTTTGHAR